MGNQGYAGRWVVTLERDERGNKTLGERVGLEFLSSVRVLE